MKKLIYLLFIIITNTAVNAQIVDINTPGNYYIEMPPGTYIKDLSNTFDVFLGTWKYQNGNEIFTIKLEKSEDLLTEYGNYTDYIKGNYSYSTDGGITYVTNTIENNFSNNPIENSLYSPGPLNQSELDLRFKDMVYNKNCNLIIKFLPNSTTQLEFKLDNQSRGYLYPEVPPYWGFSVPNHIILTKQ